jgi:hypothetical protein
MTYTVALSVPLITANLESVNTSIVGNSSLAQTGSYNVPVRTIEMMKWAVVTFTDDHPEPGAFDNATILLDSAFWQNGLFRQV